MISRLKEEILSYSKLRVLRKINANAKKTKTSIIKAVFNTKVVSPELSEILKRVKVQNIGVAPFYNTLDANIVIDNVNRMIDNIPIDYSKVLDLNLSTLEIRNDIYCFAKRINDPRINFDKATNLQEALQKILFWNSLLWQTGHKLVGLGRLDKVLDSFAVPDNVEELVSAFFKSIHCRYEFKSGTLLGDTGQIILLGGLEADGSYFCNDYTYIFIKCLKKLNLPDPKIMLRCSKNMPQDLIKLAIDCNSTGIGSPLFANDDIIIPKLIDFGYDEYDAFNYGVSACWEPLSIGNSLEQNNLANIEYGRCINETILDDSFVTCNKFDDIIDLFFDKLEVNCDLIKKNLDLIQWQKDPLLSAMMELEKDISEGGAKYNNYGILSVGMASAVNSLLNIKHLVFEQHKYCLEEIQSIIKENYNNVNEIEVFNLNRNGFGVECEESIEITNLLIARTELFFKEYRNKFGGKVKFGLSSPSYIDCAHSVGATLDGRKAGEPFQTHISRDKGEPITEIMNFESKLKFSGISCNANVLDIMLQPSLIKDNIDKFTSYIIGGIKEGIFQLQMNVLSYEQLIDAKKNPEKYPNLIVRVWGFSAYFNDLPEEYKDNLIRRAREMERIA